MSAPCYGERRDYHKIDIAVFSEALGRWQYVATTTWARSCGEACDKLAALHSNIASSNIRANYQRDSKGRKVR